MERLRPDAASELLRAIRLPFLSFRCAFKMEELVSQSWASVTFTGARHRLAFSLIGDEAQVAAESFVSGLEVAEFAPRGHILADISLLSQEHTGEEVRIALEALTVEDA